MIVLFRIDDSRLLNIVRFSTGEVSVGCDMVLLENSVRCNIGI